MTARTVVNATGVWAGDLVPEVTLRPSRGTHLVLRGSSIPGLRTSVFAPIPGTTGRFINVLPQPDGTIYIGLTDEPVDGDIPDVPEPSEPEIGFLLDVASAAFAMPLHRSDVIGAYAGLRPLLASPDGDESATSDLSRRHAVLTSTTGVVTIVGGKLTTYRRMAEDAVDAAVAHAGLDGGPVPHQRPAAARRRAASPARRARGAGPAGPPLRHRRRAGARRRPARSAGCRDEELLAPIAEGVPGDAGRADVRRHPRGRRRRRRPARPAHPGRAGAGRPRARRTRRRTSARGSR